jgi:peptidoglycan/LPS O-acetylase OafA/YrhL
VSKLLLGNMTTRMEARGQPLQRAQRPGRLAWLDSIKGLAILGIMLYHVGLPLFGVPPFDHLKDDWPPLIERVAQLGPVPHETLSGRLFLNLFRDLSWLGYQGVHLFIVLSGFGLTWSQIHRSPVADVNLRQFYPRRLRRIFPLYWAGHLFFLLTYALVGWPGWIAPLDSRFLLSLAFMRFLPQTLFYVAPAWWYVWLILQLYLVFPLLWAWLWRKGLLHFWLGTAAVTLVSRFALLIVVGNNREMWSMGALFVTRLFEFTFGMGLAYWLAWQPDGLEHLWEKRWPLMIACLVYPLAVALSFAVVGSIVAHSLIAVSLFGMTCVVSRYLLASVKVLRQVTTWLGIQSYPLMILHQPVLWGFIFWGSDRIQPYSLFLALLALFSILVVVGSAAFGLVVERASRWTIQAVSVLWLFVASRGAARSVKPKA